MKFSKYTWAVIVVCLINLIYTAQNAYMTHQSNIRFAQLAYTCDKQTEAESLAYIDKSYDTCLHYFLTHGVALVIAIIAIWVVVELYVKRKKGECDRIGKGEC